MEYHWRSMCCRYYDVRSHLLATNHLKESLMRSMLVLAAVAALSFTSVTRADDTKHEYTGVLIDNHCGDEMAKKEGASSADIQKAAAEHKKGCLMKCAKDGGLSLMSDGKMMKLDKASEEKALAYLKEKGHTPSVALEASKNDDGSLTVANIEPAKKPDAAKKDETK